MLVVKYGVMILKVSELSDRTACLSGSNNINTLVGRDGAGKSRFFRDIDETASRSMQLLYVRYVNPERMGLFKRDGNVPTNMSNDPEWLRHTRAVNQAGDLKAASAMLFCEAETLCLRRFARIPGIRSDPTCSLETDRLSKVNQLLINTFLEMGNANFGFRSLLNDETIAPQQISSGESEAVVLAVEILHFFDMIDPAKFNVLFLDEPGVHLHPDL